MARPTSTNLTERESEIMEILWDLGSATSQQVCQGLKGQPHDSSVRTILRVLQKKSLVKADRKKRPTLYRAAIPRVKAQKKAVKSLINRLFSGSAESLVVRLLEDKQLTVEQLEDLKKGLKKSPSKKKGS